MIAKDQKPQCVGSREAVERAIDATKSDQEATWDESAAKVYSIPAWHEGVDRDAQ